MLKRIIYRLVACPALSLRRKGHLATTMNCFLWSSIVSLEALDDFSEESK